MLHLKGRLISIMVLYCVALHLCWAAIIIVDASAVGATPVSALHHLIGNPHLLAATLIGAAALASSSLCMRSRWIVLLLLPQQVLLAISADGAASAILFSQFADGVVRPRAFIAADQLHVILAAFGHAVAMLSHARGQN